MAGPTIDDIIKALAGADRREISRLRTALSRKGINLGSDDLDDDKRPTVGKKLSGRLEEELQVTADNAKKFLKESLEALKGPTEDVLGPFSAINAEFKELRTQAEAFTKAGYDRSMYDFDSAISSAASRSLKLTGNLQAQRQATAALTEGFSVAAFTTSKFREQIFEAATSLQAAGFDTDAYSSILETATMSFNLSRKEIKGLTAELVSLQKQFALSPRKMMQDYDYFAKNFAYSTKRLNENFAKLQKMSRITGVDFRKLTESFGENMDTFEGSAQMAGRLNQILGKSMFSSIDLLNKTEAERAEVIRKGIQDRFGGRIDQLKKFELKAIATQLKMSPDEARRFLRGETPKALTDEKFKKMQKQDPAEVMSKMAGNLTKEMTSLSKRIGAFQQPYERSMIELTTSFREGIRTGTAFQEGVAKVSRQMSAAFLGEAKAGLDAGGMKNLNKALSTLGKSIGEKGGIVSEGITAVGQGLKLVRTAIEKSVGTLLTGDSANRGAGIASTLDGSGTKFSPQVQISQSSQKATQNAVANGVAQGMNNMNITLVVPGLGGSSQASYTGILKVDGLVLDVDQGAQQ